MRKIVLTAVVVALITGAVVWAQSTAEEQTRGEPSWARLVSVVNWPAVQTVDGTVNVGNLPARQEVSGTVSVDNLPACPGAAALVYVGFTTATFDGAAGPLGMSRGCAAEFGDGARMGTYAEILATPNPPAMIPGQWAWVFHSFETPSTCQNVTPSGGWAVQANGAYDSRTCATPLPVACVAPVQ